MIIIIVLAFFLGLLIGWANTRLNQFRRYEEAVQRCQEAWEGWEDSKGETL